MKLKSILIFTAVILLSCNSAQNSEQPQDTADNQISITREQFEAGKMVISEPEKIQFNDLVKCSGNILVEPSGTARISTPVPGHIKKIFCTCGQHVNKGEPLFELAGDAFINLQRDYAETESKLTRIKSEYERIKSLYSEKVGTEKEMIMAESEFRSVNAQYAALKLKINYLGLDESKITDGNFYKSFLIKSPLNGFISAINVTLGQFADPQMAIAESLDVNKLTLRVAVFEKDLDRLKEDQKISFSLLGNTGKSYSATLRSVGKNVDPESKTIFCYADFDDLKGSNFVNNAYVEAAIITRNETVLAVPEESIISLEGNSFILEYIKDENDIYFLKITKVSTGRLYNGYVELLDNPQIEKVITKGAYSIRID
jgi:membrane fusion protein, heavy metal efflux system